jgi:hypothetical protein
MGERGGHGLATSMTGKAGGVNTSYGDSCQLPDFSDRRFRVSGFGFRVGVLGFCSAIAIAE